MKRKLLTGLLVAILLVAMVLPAGITHAADPTVSITVSAELVAITNSQANWAIGTILVDAVVYFSATGAADPDYSLITNTGNVAADIEIQGEDIDGTAALDWTLAAAAGIEIYQLDADADEAGTYAIEVKSAAYTNIKEDLAALGTCKWSMKFTAPSAFNGAEDGAQKTSTVTLVASKHV